MDKLKSSRLWAQELFAAVRGREPSCSEADEWVVRTTEHYISRVKREAFVAGAERYKTRMLSLTPHDDQLNIKTVPLMAPSPVPEDFFATLSYAAARDARPFLPRISSDRPAAITPVTPAITKASK
jgi:hypothetical protein